MQRNYKKINKIIYAFIFGSIFLIVFGVTFTKADTVSNLRDKIESTSNEIKRLEEEIRIYESSLNQTASKAASLKNELDALNTSKKKLETQLKITTQNLSKTNATIGTIAIEIEETLESIDSKRQAIASSINEMRMAENTSVIESFLSTKNLTETSEFIEQADRINGAIASHVLELQGLYTSLTGKKANEEIKKGELKKLQSELSGQQKAISDTASQKDRLLSDTKNQEANYKKILDDKIKQRAEFEKELFKFESELKIAIDPKKLPSVKTGVLSWPLESVYITQQFGQTSASGRLYASGTHNGIDLRATDGTKVLASLSGSVTATGNTDLKKGCYSYGKWILIKHANGLSTLYGHLSSISVNPGDSVSTGDVIGYSGRTGYVTGPHLHLTVVATEGVRVMPIPTATGCSGVTIPIGTPQAFLDPLLYLPK